MDEIRSLKEEIRRAERNPNKTSSQRRKTYERVLHLAKSNDVASKKLATESIKDFFADFPEYQDSAINAVYDLCEEPDRDTRLAGYSALVSLSQADRKWVVRNADVLVQLLQVDDENEVAFVRHALQQHIDLDATRTFKVLCDQCTFDASGAHPEEAERLRELVINFLKERYRSCVARVVKDDEVWNVLFHGLLQAIPQSSSIEVVTIVRDILVHAPQFSIPSYRDGATKVGNIVLDVLLDSAKASLQAELDSLSSSTKSKRSAIPKSCMFLALAAYITTPLSYMPPYNAPKSLPIDPRNQKLNHPSTASADALNLIRFYISLLGRDGLLRPKVFQNRLTKTAASRIAWYVARAWEGCEDMANNLRRMVHCSKSDLQKARDDLVDVSPTLLSIVAHNSLRNVNEGSRLRRAAHTLVRACVDRERSTKEAWAAPDGFEESLQAVLAIVSDGKSDTAKDAESWDVADEYIGEEMEPVSSSESTLQNLKEIENLLRSLLDAKGTEEEREAEVKGDEGVTMDIDAPPGSASVAQKTASAPASQQPKAASSKTALDVINARRRESERDRQRLLPPKPPPAQEPRSEQRPSLSRANSLSVRGAASSVQANKTAASTTVDVDMKEGAPLSVASNHAQVMLRGDPSSRPSKRAKSFTSQGNGNLTSTTVFPTEDAISRTPSLLARLQPSDERNVMGGGSAPTGSLASRLLSPLSPSLTSSKSVSDSVSATSSEAQSTSRGHRSKPASAHSSTGFVIKGQAESVTKLANGPQGYPEGPPTSSGISEFKIRGAAQRGGDDDDSGGKLSLLDRLRDSSLAGEDENKSKKRKR